MRPRLLDLFCGAGGCSVGYVRAGFEVVGVDIAPQPNYPFEFIQADALEYLASIDFASWPDAPVDAIHASPPCQAFTVYKNHGRVKDSPNLIPQTRELLEATGLPYVIENVESAAAELSEDAVTICGTMFDPPMEVQRHRLFETNWALEPPMWPCRHKLNGKDRYPGGRSKERTGSTRGLVRGTIEIGTWDIDFNVQKQAMGVAWDVTLEELSEMIPPAYTEFIGTQLLAHVRQEAVA